MTILDFFCKYPKMNMLRGKGIINPAETQYIDSQISCIREGDVNFWIFQSDNTKIAFDCGYKNYLNIDEEFEKIHLNPNEVKAVFLTHIDEDHAGGVDQNSRNIFPNAKIYLGAEEKCYLYRQACRFQFGYLKVYNGVKLGEHVSYLQNDEKIYIGDCCIHAIYVPGHTKGHICYIINDKILITGDCIAINEKGGHCFFDFFNVDTELNFASLKNLKTFLQHKQIDMICTGHSGVCYDIQKAFLCIDCLAVGSRKKPFDTSAPYQIPDCSIMKRRWKKK